MALQAATQPKVPSGTVKPVRLQILRVKGFNLQTLSLEANGLHALKCTRPGRLGNPFHTRMDGTAMTREEAVMHFRAQIEGYGWFMPDKWAKPTTIDDIITFLRGKNGACFCPLDGRPCHVDVEMEIANR